MNSNNTNHNHNHNIDEDYDLDLMAYTSTFNEDSGDDDDSFMSPTLPPHDFSPTTESDLASPEHTPTTFTHSYSAHASPTGRLTEWTAHQCADWISTLGLNQYAGLLIEESVNGEALVEMQNQDLKEMGIASVGHRLTLLKAVYDVKVKHNIRLDPDHYVPLSAEGNAYDMTATQDDITRVIRSIELRDQRIYQAETELRFMRDNLERMLEENRKLREDTLPVIRMMKDRQPLPVPDQPMTTPPADIINIPDRKLSSGLSRKFSTKKLFLGSTPKNPSPTIHESSSLDPSAAAMAASQHLMSSQPSPNTLVPQLSPTSPAYSQQASSAGNRSFPRDNPPSARQAYDDHHTYSGYAASAATATSRRREAPTSAPMDDPPLSASLPPNTSLAPSLASSSRQQQSSQQQQSSSRESQRDRDRDRDRDRSERNDDRNTSDSNPQVEIFKSFRVSIEDPCHKVLPVALKRYNIQDDWRQYALYIVYGDQERCLGLEEKPLMLFKQLDREGKKPMFMLRKHASPPGHEGFFGHGEGHREGGAGVGVGGRGMGGGGREAERGLPGGVL